MMNTVLRKIASVAIYSLVLFSASAETLAWYHFSEQEDGVQASMAENVIKDSSPRQKDGSVFTVHNKAVVTDDSLLPTYRTYECLVDDPLNGVQMSNGTALDFAAIGQFGADRLSRPRFEFHGRQLAIRQHYGRGADLHDGGHV